MRAIRMRAFSQLIWELKYPTKRRGGRSIADVERFVNRYTSKEWRYGWNACASFVGSFVEGERLESNLTGGLRVKA
jgi:hypothetical protein